MITQTGIELNTKTLFCDIDGCLCDWNTGFRELLYKLHGKREVTLLRYAMQAWNWHKALGYTNKEIDQAWDQVDDWWWKTLDAYPQTNEALLLLDDLRKRNPDFQVYFVTGRHATVQQASTIWLNTHGFVCPSVITSSRKAELAQVFEKDGPIAVIEDKPAIIQAYARSTVARIYIIEQPYNRLLPYSVHYKATVFDAVRDLIDHWQLKTETPHAESSEALVKE